MTKPLLEIRELTTEIQTRRAKLAVVNSISLHVNPGEVVGLVGESGSGKSMTAYSLLQLFPTKAAQLRSGEIWFEGQNLARLKPKALQKIRGQRMSMIFQDPAGFLDPLYPIGRQLAESLKTHGFTSGITERVTDLLDQMGLPDSQNMLRRYPHELSGGQRQRVMIAMALACQPSLLIADEPTTALDVTIQAQILDLLNRLRQEQNLAILLITHDLGVVAELCDRVYVMYGGRIVETNTTLGLFRSPAHPYTQGLIKSTLTVQPDSLASETKSPKLFSIPGTVPNLGTLLNMRGCPFQTRCPLRQTDCYEKEPVLTPENGGLVACWHTKQAQNNETWNNL